MYQKILVPVDGSETSKLGLQEAIRLAKTTGAELRIMHVVNEFVSSSGYEYLTSQAYDMLLEAYRARGNAILGDAKKVAAAAHVKFTAEMIETAGGRVSQPILETAHQWVADLIVMGTHGRRGLGRLVLGSDAEMVLRSSPVPVLFVRGPSVGT